MAITYPRYHREPELARSGQSLRNWVRRQLLRDPVIPRRELTARAREVGYVPADARGSLWMGGTLQYLRDRGEIEIHAGVVHAVSLAHRLDSSDAFDLGKLVRRRLRGKQAVSRTALRVELREARLLSWGILGAQRLNAVLIWLVRRREIAIIADTIIPLSLRPETKRRKLYRPPSARKLKRSRAEQRARKVAKRSASQSGVFSTSASL